MKNSNERKFAAFCAAVTLFLLVAGRAGATTFELIDGKTMNGDIVAMDERGIILKQPDGTYTDPIAWARFSQSDLRAFRDNPKAAGYVEPFIEVTRTERMQGREIELKPVPPLEHPANRSLVLAMLSTPIGLFMLLVLYGTNLYAAMEVAAFTGRPAGMVCGVSAIFPWLGPALFLYLPSPGTAKPKPVVPQDWRPEEEYRNAPAAAPLHLPTAVHAAPVAAPPATMPTPTPQKPATPIPLPTRPQSVPEPEVPLDVYEPEPTLTASTLPPTKTFLRGQFTFNRRFFETQMPAFFAVARPEEIKDLVLSLRSVRGNFVALRIARITATELTLQVQRGNASEDVAVPFIEIQEVQIKHKDA
jgi:hypothetical protein